MSKQRLKWSEYIPHRPSRKQLEALLRPEKELLFGGALGGGKSDFLLMCCLQYMDVPGYASAIFRKNLTDLKLPGALLDRTRTWLQPYLSSKRIRYVPSEHTFYFPTRYPDGSRGEDARLAFGYLADANAKDRYQSAEYQTIAFDEISHWETDSDYSYMRTRLRRTVCNVHGKDKNGDPIWIDDCMICQIKRDAPVRLRAATNPGGLGGNWIKKRFQIVPDPTLYADRREALIAISNGIKVPYVGTHPKRAFVPSYITDNPFLDQKDYDEFLNDMSPEMRSQLRDGNWDIRPDSRFQRVNARYFRLYEDSYQIGNTIYPFSSFKRIIMTVDPASTVKAGIVDERVHKQAPSFTAISVFGITENNDLMWLNLSHFRSEVPDVVEEIKNDYVKWRPRYSRMETNGVGAGPAQYIKRIGIPVMEIRKNVDKLENSLAAGLLMRAGKIWFPDNVPWIDECEDEVFSWTGLPQETDDIIDNLSDAANDVGPLSELFDNVEDTSKNVVPTIYVPRGVNNFSPTLSQGNVNRISRAFRGNYLK